MPTHPPTTPLSWPFEGALAATPTDARFSQAGSNLCLDFHGDPCSARLTVFSDGNHHMALADALALFQLQHPDVQQIFYATTPPRVIVDALRSGRLWLGHLALTSRPHVFISPAPVLQALASDGLVSSHQPFVGHRGCALLHLRSNPRGIRGLADLQRPDVRLFMSNPVTEKVSHDIYAATLRQAAAAQGVDFDFLPAGAAPAGKLVLGDSIHHREAPQAVADGRADVAIVFSHLALRYQRVFEPLFDSLPITVEPGAPAGDLTHIGLVGTGGEWGARLLSFMRGPEVAAVYRHHGLVPAP